MSNQELKRFEEHDDRERRIAETAAKTKNALNKILGDKLENSKVTTLSSSSTNDESTYIKYTSAQISNLVSDRGTSIHKQRIIKITDEKLDPMLPSSRIIRKAPQGPHTEDTVPVLHDESGTEKLTKGDQKKWNITPAVSNWKNTKGFIIGIDNRVMNSTQRGSTVTQEDVERGTKRFTALSNALKNAEKKAKEDIQARSSWRKQKAAEKSAETQERLSKLAQEARRNRSDLHATEIMSKFERREERRRRAQEDFQNDKTSTKDKIRKLAKEQGRTVSDRVVIGVTEALKQKQEDTVFDSNLYLKSRGSIDPGDGDKVYDTPLFSREAVLSDIYRTRNIKGHTGLGGVDKTTDDGFTSVSFVRESEMTEEEAEEKSNESN